MSIGLGVTEVFRANSANINAAADRLTVAVVKPLNVVRFGFIVDSSESSGTTVVISLDKRVTAGSDTGRVELATLQPAATVAQGKGVFKDLVTREEINPGEELILEVKTAAGGTAPTAHVFIEAVDMAFQRTSGTPADDRLDNMTEVT